MVIDRCPHHGFNYRVEDLLVRLWVKESRGVPALSFWTAPAWMNEAITLIGNIQTRAQAEQYDKMNRGSGGMKPATVL